MGTTGSKDGHAKKGTNADSTPVAVADGAPESNPPLTPKHADSGVSPRALYGRTVERSAKRQTGFPTLIRWHGQAQTVAVTGTFNNWDPKGDAMSKGTSDDEFVILLHLDKGKHEFKFIVDGQVKVDLTQPTLATTDGVQNMITVKSPEEAAVEADDGDGAGRDGSGANLNASDVQWGQEETVFEETRKFPPLCPPHLCYTPLNTPPQMRCFGDAPLLPSSFGEDLTLPLPLHVTVNHVYFQRRDRYFLMGVTTRFSNKYSTVVFYKKLDHAAPALGADAHAAPAAAAHGP